jgi:creatinine amidohydrolase
MELKDYLPQRVNTGPWLSHYTLNELRQLDPDADLVLPFGMPCTPARELTSQGDLILPPLYLDALDVHEGGELQSRILRQIERCFPEHESTRADRGPRPKLRVVTIAHGVNFIPSEPDVLAFSVDTAVEEHGPHLPLATDTIQSYAVLQRLAGEFDRFELAPPVDYGQLTWGLPFGFSIDLTAELLTEYVTRFTNAMLIRRQPKSVYVVDVHGSIVHRRAIVAGLKQSHAERWLFRWLHEPLGEFASERGDQHAGGVETALVEHINPQLLDPAWWPGRMDELERHQMSFERAVELTPDLSAFNDHVREHACNGIVGRIENYGDLDAELMFGRMLDIARRDVEALVSGQPLDSQGAGENLW